MRAFLAAKEQFAVHLRPEDVYAALPPERRPGDVDAVVKALDSLAEWGSLRRTRTRRGSRRWGTSTASGSSTS